jgi:2,3-bisphosphoglycerate-dependent phosphoglycerate mutase
MKKNSIDKIYKVVFVRHGESTWNKENRFTGWTDVKLTENGVKEAQFAGQLLKQNGYKFDVAHTSVLSRAIMTYNTIATELD